MDTIQVSQEKQVLLIKINRPEKLNALSPAMYHALGRALARLNNDTELRVAVLHAEGRHFTSGVELDLWAPILGSGVPFPVQPGEIDPLGLTGERHKKPLIIAVQGYCFTWGVEMLLNTEIRIAARDTRFQMLEVQRGLFPCAGATLERGRRLSLGHDTGCCRTGRAIRQGYGICAHCRGGRAAWSTGPSKIHAYCRKGISRHRGEADVCGFSGGAQASRPCAASSRWPDLIPVMQSHDAAEGVKSFLEKRKAVFQGR